MINDKKIDIRSVSPESLVDIKDVVIDESLPVAEKIRQFKEQIKTPQCYKYNDIIIMNEYSNDGKDLKECFKQIVMTI